MQGEYVDHPLPPETEGMVVFITGTGCYLRALIDTPEKAACILRVAPQGKGYYITHGGYQADFRPTSELISHIKIHHYMVESGSTHRAIVHTHPLELIVLSHLPQLFNDEELLNHTLWKMCPEIFVFVPKGVGCCPYRTPSSVALADATLASLANRDVILWEKHGALATGEDVEKAFDYLDVANKGAKMYLMAKAAGFEPEGLSQKQMKDLEVFTHRPQAEK
ncbi:unnamed protein product [Cyprideis torosa]|uniref:Uncharacterized protein n=1 Tax=Cyprideis torosa TaxID=163714 RepID=A0A7R8X000_9CRUS|nr:unnamed protein product [Cyprideis torosa]CAG0910573.1 unnamed protein product [Cyprideis torosa]